MVKSRLNTKVSSLYILSQEYVNAHIQYIFLIKKVSMASNQHITIYSHSHSLHQSSKKKPHPFKLGLSSSKTFHLRFLSYVQSLKLPGRILASISFAFHIPTSPYTPPHTLTSLSLSNLSSSHLSNISPSSYT